MSLACRFAESWNCASESAKFVENFRLGVIAHVEPMNHTLVDFVEESL